MKISASKSRRKTSFGAWQASGAPIWARPCSETDCGTWDIVDGSSIPVLRNGTAVITPIDKVYKRFVNGREDSVLSFYTYMLKL